MTQSRIRRAYQEGLPVPSGSEPHLAQALGETLDRPGNLVRAELAFQIGRAYHLPEKAAEQLAVALEYFHTASLLFDDLPSMDNATHRRGAVCLHGTHGEGTTILTALALINRAYALIWRSMAAAPGANHVRATDYVERHLGLGGILDGQSRDLHYSDEGGTRDGAQAIALGKTSSLIRLPLVLPAILGGASPEECHLLDRLAKLWGLSYQALDDLKDVLREQHEVGKTTGQDQTLRRPNAALELGTEAVVARLNRLAALTDRLVWRLTRLQPALAFLHRVNRRFDAELKKTVEDALPLPSVEAVACFS